MRQLPSPLAPGARALGRVSQMPCVFCVMEAMQQCVPPTDAIGAENESDVPRTTG